MSDPREPMSEEAFLAWLSVLDSSEDIDEQG
jgi:hypothetical protein